MVVVVVGERARDLTRSLTSAPSWAVEGVTTASDFLISTPSKENRPEKGMTSLIPHSIPCPSSVCVCLHSPGGDLEAVIHVRWPLGALWRLSWFRVA